VGQRAGYSDGGADDFDEQFEGEEEGNRGNGDGARRGGADGEGDAEFDGGERLSRRHKDDGDEAEGDRHGRGGSVGIVALLSPTSIADPLMRQHSHAHSAGLRSPAAAAAAASGHAIGATSGRGDAGRLGASGSRGAGAASTLAPLALPVGCLSTPRGGRAALASADTAVTGSARAVPPRRHLLLLLLLLQLLCPRSGACCPTPLLRLPGRAPYPYRWRCGSGCIL